MDCSVKLKREVINNFMREDHIMIVMGPWGPMGFDISDYDINEMISNYNKYVKLINEIVCFPDDKTDFDPYEQLGVCATFLNERFGISIGRFRTEDYLKTFKLLSSSGYSFIFFEDDDDDDSLCIMTNRGYFAYSDGKTEASGCFEGFDERKARRTKKSLLKSSDADIVIYHECSEMGT